MFWIMFWFLALFWIVFKTVGGVLCVLWVWRVDLCERRGRGGGGGGLSVRSGPTSACFFLGA